MSSLWEAKEETLVEPLTVEAQLYSYDQALGAAQEVVSTIKPFCQRIEICGGIRRHKDQVHDIDIVAQDTDRFMLMTMLGQICYGLVPTSEKLTFNTGAIPGEIFFVQNEQQFEVMKLVRTGDFAFNRSLTQAAHTKGLVFRFSKDKGHYKIPMYGLYRITGTWWDEDADRAHRKTHLIGDMINAVAYKEKDIIELIFSKYYEPEQRSWWDSGYDPDAYGGRGEPSSDNKQDSPEGQEGQDQSSYWRTWRPRRM